MTCVESCHHIGINQNSTTTYLLPDSFLKKIVSQIKIILKIQEKSPWRKYDDDDLPGMTHRHNQKREKEKKNERNSRQPWPRCPRLVGVFFHFFLSLCCCVVCVIWWGHTSRFLKKEYLWPLTQKRQERERDTLPPNNVAPKDGVYRQTGGGGHFSLEYKNSRIFFWRFRKKKKTKNKSRKMCVCNRTSSSSKANNRNHKKKRATSLLIQKRKRYVCDSLNSRVQLQNTR